MTADTYAIYRQSGNGAFVVATSNTYDEALRIADAFTRKDRTLHTVRKAR